MRIDAFYNILLDDIFCNYRYLLSEEIFNQFMQMYENKIYTYIDLQKKFLRGSENTGFCNFSSTEIIAFRAYLNCKCVSELSWQNDVVNEQDLCRRVVKSIHGKIGRFYNEFFQNDCRLLKSSMLSADIDPRNILIMDCNFDTNLKNILCSIYVNGNYIKLKTFGDLVELKTEQLLRVYGIGDGYYNQILDTVHMFGLCFSDERYDEESGEYVTIDVLGFSPEALRNIADLKDRMSRRVSYK